MIKIYKPVDLDWLNYRVTPSNPLTFHHIIKKEHSGKEIVENGALITEIGHQYLHLIECKNIDTYILLNKIFKMVNEQKSCPTDEQRELIEYILREFELVHKNDKNSKGESLIKYKYLKRDYKR